MDAATLAPGTLAPGTLVLACSKFGLWMRARVEAGVGSDVRVRWVEGPEPTWLPALSGIVDGEREVLTPERIALCPAEAPRALPPIGSPVIALWDGRRFHKGTLIGASGARGIVRFDEGDELSFAPAELLSCGAPRPEGVAKLRARGLEVGKAVRTIDDHGNRADGWISELGSERVLVRRSGISWGLWAAPERVSLGGRGRREEPPAVGEPGPGARARVRWLDREIYDAIVLAVDGDRITVRYDDGTVQAVERVRVTPLEPPPARQVEQLRAHRPIGPWIPGAEALAQPAGQAVWVPVRVLAVRGVQALVAPESGPPFWSWGSRMAGALPDPERFPARGTPVVTAIEIERRGKRGKRPAREILRRHGRADEVLGDRLTVKLADGERATATLAQLWQRGEKIEGRATFEAGARADVEREPGAWEGALVVGQGEQGELVKVRFDRDGKQASVDRTRLRVRPPEPKVARPPEPPPPPATPPPPPPPSAEETSAILLRAIVARWGFGSYRGDALAEARVDETAISLPVERGALLVRVRGDTIEITADAGASDALPPAEAPLVRLGAWVRRWLGGPAGQDAADRDRAWALELCGAGLADAQRAGGALTIGLWSTDPDEIVRVARAAHERIVRD